MKTDNQIQNDVIDELKWEPALNSSEIGVAVKNGIVTLSGQVDTYSKKVAAERAAKKISGVKAVAEDIQVGLSPAYRKTDTEIAEAVLYALRWHTAVQHDQIKIKVEDGNVQLEGEVEWEFQKNNARAAIENLTGVRSVTNLITLKPQINPSELERKIKAAFQRSASIDAARIRVEVMDNRVILKGSVRSFAESEDAEDAAWAAPGVLAVENKLDVSAKSEYAL